MLRKLPKRDQALLKNKGGHAKYWLSSLLKLNKTQFWLINCISKYLCACFNKSWPLVPIFLAIYKEARLLPLEVDKKCISNASVAIFSINNLSLHSITIFFFSKDFALWDFLVVVVLEKLLAKIKFACHTLVSQISSVLDTLTTKNSPKTHFCEPKWHEISWLMFLVWFL